MIQIYHLKYLYLLRSRKLLRNKRRRERTSESSRKLEESSAQCLCLVLEKKSLLRELLNPLALDRKPPNVCRKLVTNSRNGVNNFIFMPNSNLDQKSSIKTSSFKMKSRGPRPFSSNPAHFGRKKLMNFMNKTVRDMRPLSPTLNMHRKVALNSRRKNETRRLLREAIIDRNFKHLNAP